MCLPEEERDRVKDMALEAVVYPQTQDPFSYGIKDFYNFNFNTLVAKEQEQEHRSFSFVENQTENNCPPYVDWNNNNSSTFSPPHLNEVQETTTDPSSNTNNTQNFHASPSVNTVIRPKRRRARSRKNKEEIENQRMTHIAVERNRRKQMNEYLSILRSLMPDSHIQRGDQASIIGRSY
uniref:BHLH domain-containing protein n=1 Tax=Medicago truncatula TaxID=3880 RepID=I3SKG3_MEDTR|nr:unknown [Medicago truncatula]